MKDTIHINHVFNEDLHACQVQVQRDAPLHCDLWPHLESHESGQDFCDLRLKLILHESGVKIMTFG